MRRWRDWDLGLKWLWENLENNNFHKTNKTLYIFAFFVGKENLLVIGIRMG